MSSKPPISSDKSKNRATASESLSSSCSQNSLETPICPKRAIPSEFPRPRLTESYLSETVARDFARNVVFRGSQLPLQKMSFVCALAQFHHTSPVSIRSLITTLDRSRSPVKKRPERRLNSCASSRKGPGPSSMHTSHIEFKRRLRETRQ
jgi:hypothetical protein